MRHHLTSIVCKLVMAGFAVRHVAAASNTITIVRSRALNEGDGATLGSPAATAEVDIDPSGIKNVPSITLQGLEDDQSMVFSHQTLGGGNENYWYGEMDGEHSGSATLIQDPEGKITGSFSDENNVYQMNTLPDGTVKVDTFSYDQFKDDGNFVSSGGLTLGGGNRHLSNLRGAVQNKTKARELRSTVVDVLVVYTRQAMCAEAGKRKKCKNKNKGAIEARIKLAEAETNLSYDNSGIDARINVVHMHLDESDFNELNGDLEKMVSALEDTDGYLDYVQDLRNRVKADLVTMIVESGEYCGFGNVGKPFSVTKRICSTGYFSFGHEIAHNMGCYHDRQSSQGFQHVFAHGYQDPSERFRSIMASDCLSRSCRRVPMYSNRSHKYNGSSIGNFFNDCARQIDLNAPTVAAWR